MPGINGLTQTPLGHRTQEPKAVAPPATNKAIPQKTHAAQPNDQWAKNFWSRPGLGDALLSCQPELMDEAFDIFCKASSQNQVAARDWLLSMVQASAQAANYLKRKAEIQLLDAARNGYLEKVQAWLQFPGIDVNYQSPPFLGSRTPLHWAISRNRVSVVETLLKAPQIDIHIQDAQGDTPHSLAQKSRNQTILTLLDQAISEQAQTKKPLSKAK